MCMCGVVADMGLGKSIQIIGFVAAVFGSFYPTSRPRSQRSAASASSASAAAPSSASASASASAFAESFAQSRSLPVLIVAPASILLQWKCVTLSPSPLLPSDLRRAVL
jgi:hypothetical protein